MIVSVIGFFVFFFEPFVAHLLFKILIGLFAPVEDNRRLMAGENNIFQYGVVGGEDRSPVEGIEFSDRENGLPFVAVQRLEQEGKGNFQCVGDALHGFESQIIAGAVHDAADDAVGHA